MTAPAPISHRKPHPEPSPLAQRAVIAAPAEFSAYVTSSQSGDRVRAISVIYKGMFFFHNGLSEMHH